MTESWAVAFALAFSAAFGATAADRDPTPAELFKSASNSIVTVHGYGKDGVEVSQGSGVVVASGVVVTNCHVFVKSDTARVGYQAHRFEAVLRNADTQRDLCSFDVPKLRAPAVRFGTTARLQVGDKVFAIGAPQGLELTLSDGLLSSIRSLEGESLLQFTAPISPGSSGGGLFDSSGRLIGITTLYLKESQQINFAVPVEWIAELPRRSAMVPREGDDSAVASSELEAAKRELNALEANWRASDPVGYEGRKDRLVTEVRRIATEYPTERWIPEIRQAYQRLMDDDAAAADAAQAAADEQAAADAIARWQLVDDNSESTVWLDTLTLERTGSDVKVWSKWVLKQPSKDSVAYMLTDVRFDCAGRSMKIEALTSYSASDRPIRSSGPDRWQRVIPESSGEKLWNAACE